MNEAKQQRQDVIPKIWVADLAAYNNGYLHGCWLNAARPADEIWNDIQRLLAVSPVDDSEEIAIFDHEGFGPVEVDEYESIEMVSRLACGIVENGRAFAWWAHQLDRPDWDNLLDSFEYCFHGHFDDTATFVTSLLENVDMNFEDKLPELIAPSSTSTAWPSLAIFSVPIPASPTRPASTSSTHDWMAGGSSPPAISTSPVPCGAVGDHPIARRITPRSTPHAHPVHFQRAGLMKTTSIRLSDETHAQLAALAQFEQTSISELLTAAIDAFLASKRQDPELAGKAEDVLAEIDREAANRREAIATLFGGDAEKEPPKSRARKPRGGAA